MKLLSHGIYQLASNQCLSVNKYLTVFQVKLNWNKDIKTNIESETNFRGKFYSMINDHACSSELFIWKYQMFQIGETF